MTFNQIEKDTNCVCIKDAFEDFQGVYARKINKKGATPKERDFKSYWEGGKRPDDETDCNLTCRYKGVSINPWNTATKNFVQELFTESVRISPKHKKKICIFKLAAEGGRYRHTPIEGNEDHHDLMKSDQFSMESILLQEMIAIDV